MDLEPKHGEAHGARGYPMSAVAARAVRFVTVKTFENLTGYTEKAVERKRHEGVWREGREYRRAPDGRILIDLQGFESWVVGVKGVSNWA